MYKIVLDRAVGIHPLHKNVAIVCAGNLETDNAIVNPMSTALQSRLVHLELLVDPTDWNVWATTAGIDHRITSFIGFKPGNLFTFQPDHSDKTYACPRTWEFADRLMKLTNVASPDLLPLLAGTLSEGVAREFLVFCKIHESMPKIPQIIAAPEQIVVPHEPSVLFALSGSISHHASKDNVSPLMKFIHRMPVEFQIITVKEANRRNKTLITTPAMQEWVRVSGHEMF